MPDILLTTLNARYHHSSFGLRYLLANMAELTPHTRLLEFGINQLPLEILDALLAEQPRIIGLGVYIWNVEPILKLLADLKQLRPDVTVVLGGPEVSYETESQPLTALADYVIQGEADLAFPALCRQLLAGLPPAGKIIPAPLPALADVRLPYHLYTDEDIARRVIYVEASRGCPFTCEFCLSALDIPVRQFPLEEFLAAMQSLLDRGARQFKFVDRTFNLNLRVGSAILEFFLERWEPGLFLHFEMIPDRLPDQLRQLVAKFPPGALQFEVGIQTFNAEVCELISRRQDNDKVRENLAFLREHTGVHVHADLIAGLPGETLESFGTGFDRLMELGPQEIQVGILKRLRGTPIIRHDADWQMVYSPHPPYEILQNRLLSFEELGRLRRFARFWDLLGNSGNFVETLPLLWQDSSPFAELLRLSDWLYLREGKGHSISLIRLAEALFVYLTEIQGQPADRIAQSLWRDYQRGGRTDKPAFLRGFQLQVLPRETAADFDLPARQRRRLFPLLTHEDQ